MSQFVQILDIVVDLAPEAFVVIGLVAAYLILIYAIISFVEESGKLRNRLYQVDSELQALRSQFPHRRRQIKALKKSIVPLRTDFRQLCEYYAELRDLQLEAEREAMGEDGPEDREIAVRDNFDILPTRTPYALASTSPLLNPDPTRYN